MIRKLLTGAAVVLGTIALSITPAEARPGEPGDRSYLGPLTSAHFAGHKVIACAPYNVFSLTACRTYR